MRRLRTSVIAVCVFACAGASVLALAASEDAAQDELAKFQGNWEMSSMTFEGNDAGAGAKARRVFKGEKSTLFLGAENRGVQSIKVDASKNPAQIDLKHEDGPLAGETIKGIYKFDGGILTLAYRGLGKERPADFTSKAGSGVFLETFKRPK